MNVDVRFWSNVKMGQHDECWPWTGFSHKGYGRFAAFGKRAIRAHVYAFETCVEELLPGNEVLHSCDNTLCCNPDHLSQGTHAENMRQMAERRRASHHAKKSDDEPCPAGHLGPWRFNPANGGRVCVRCETERRRAWRQQRREAGLPVS